MLIFIQISITGLPIEFISVQEAAAVANMSPGARLPSHVGGEEGAGAPCPCTSFLDLEDRQVGQNPILECFCASSLAVVWFAKPRMAQIELEELVSSYDNAST